MLKNLSLKNSKKLQRKTFRESFVKAELKNNLTLQIRLNRKHRGLSQNQLAEKIGSTQSAVSRIEDPAYGNFTINTLLDIANAFDIGLQIKFVPFTKLIGEHNSWEPHKTIVESFSEEHKKHSNNTTNAVAQITSACVTTPSIHPQFTASSSPKLYANT
jgi:transcriptional regulator with XRE-family HTH domain